jgi:hypothetical protein
VRPLHPSLILIESTTRIAAIVSSRDWRTKTDLRKQPSRERLQYGSQQSSTRHSCLILGDVSCAPRAQVSGPLQVPAPSDRALLVQYKFLDRIDSPSYYDAPEYFLEPYWAGKRPFVVLALYENQVVGVLSGLHSEAATGCGVLSRPQVRIDEKLDSLFPSDLLAEGLLREAGRDKLITVYAWNWVPLEGFEQRGFLRRELEGNVVLDLHLGPGAIYKGFHENRKRNIRAAFKNGIEISEATTPEDLMAYWEVYSRWRQTKRKNITHNLSFATIEKVHHLRHNHRRFLARFWGKGNCRHWSSLPA